MNEIKFDLGQSIVETAKNSGVKSFSIDDVNGWIEYSTNWIPSQANVKFNRPGYEFTWQPLFAFSLYTDRKRYIDLRVSDATLQLDSKFLSHGEALSFVKKTLLQFNAGRWKRYCDVQSNTLLTGRSSLLDESGVVNPGMMPLDPAYDIGSDDWRQLRNAIVRWQWAGDGVLVELTVDGRDLGDPPKPSYDMFIKLSLLEEKLKRDAENRLLRLKEGDARGWESTSQAEHSKIATLARLKVLEANARKRGDAVLTPH